MEPASPGTKSGEREGGAELTKARGPGGTAWREPRLLTAFHVSGVCGVRGDGPGEGGAPQEFTRELFVWLPQLPQR